MPKGIGSYVYKEGERRGDRRELNENDKFSRRRGKEGEAGGGLVGRMAKEDEERERERCRKKRREGWDPPLPPPPLSSLFHASVRPSASLEAIG